MIKNYKLALMLLLVSCSLSNAMDNNESKNKESSNWIHILARLLAKNAPKLYYLTPDGNDLTTPTKEEWIKIYEEVLQNKDMIHKTLSENIIKEKGTPTAEHNADNMIEVLKKKIENNADEDLKTHMRKYFSDPKVLIELAMAISTDNTGSDILIMKKLPE